MLALQRLTGEYHGYVSVTVQSRFSRWPAYRQGRTKLSLPATYSNKTSRMNAPPVMGCDKDSGALFERFQRGKKKATLSSSLFRCWLREPDLNRRPSGYEPDELPDCSIPRLCGGILQSDDKVSTVNAKHRQNNRIGAAGVPKLRCDKAFIATRGRVQLAIIHGRCCSWMNGKASLAETGSIKCRPQKRPLFRVAFFDVWLREPDLNRRPSGYEPDELPDCSIPRLCGGILQRIFEVSSNRWKKFLFLQAVSEAAA